MIMQRSPSRFKRVILRPTREYYSHISNKELIKNIIPEESIQLSRNDIPYFFKAESRSDLLFFTSENVIDKVNSSVNFAHILKDFSDAQELVWPDEKIKVFCSQFITYFYRKNNSLVHTEETELKIVQEQNTIFANFHQFNLNFKIKYD